MIQFIFQNSNLHIVTYHNKSLEIIFKNTEIRTYFNVNRLLFDNLINSKDKDRYFINFIESNFNFILGPQFVSNSITVEVLCNLTER